MAQQVNSFTELLQITSLENPIFDGLDELFSPNTFNNQDLSMLDMLEPAIQATFPASQAIVPNVHPDSDPAQSVPLRKIFTQQQHQALQDFMQAYRKPTYRQKLQLGEQIGLTVTQITDWLVRKRTGQNVQKERQEFYFQQTSKIRDLQAQLREYQEAFNNITCPHCGNRVALTHEQPLRIEVTPPQPEIQQTVSTNDPRDTSHKGKAVMDFSSDPIHSSSIYAPPSAINLTINEQTPIMTDKALISQIRKSVIDELFIMATAEMPLWISVPMFNSIRFQEHLYEAEYKRVFTRGIDLKPEGFHSESSRYSATIPISPKALVKILMDVDQWSSMFSSIISRAKINEVMSNGTLGSYNNTAQVMTAEFQVITPYIPTRVSQFVRYCQQQSEESWVIADISVDLLSLKLSPHSRSQCQKRPSGCFIQGLSDGNSLVVWVEHVDVKDQHILRQYRSLVESGIAFGARRWIAILQREVERSLYVDAVFNSPGDLCVTTTAEGRKSLLQMAHIIVSQFCADIGNSTIHDWIIAEQTKCRGQRIKVSTNKIRGRPNKPPGLTRTAAATFQHCVSHSRLLDYLRAVHLRNQWDHLSIGKLVKEVVHITTGHDARNCISLLQIDNVNDTFILQECCTDSTGSYIVFAPIDILTIQQLLVGADPGPFILKVSGFSIQPDMLAYHRAEAYPDNPSIGSLVTIGAQISADSLPKKKGSVNQVCQLVQGTVERIRSAVI